MAAIRFRTLRRAAPVLVVCLVVQALLGWIGARAYLASHNTLAANTNWVSTKTRLERGVVGAYRFVHERQGLAGGRLNLGAWHGFQEVVWHRELAGLRSLEFDFELRRRAWLAVIVNRAAAGGRFHAIRLAPGRRSRNALLTVGEGGRFLAREPLGGPAVRGRTEHHARIELGAGRLTVLLDGEEMGSFAVDARPHQLFGFRGGIRPAAVDNVVVRFGDGRTVRDSFDAPSGSRRFTAMVVGAVVLLNLALFLLLSAALGGSGRLLANYFLMVNLTLLVIGVLVYLFIASRSDWYPGLSRSLAEKEAYFRRGESARILDQVAERFAQLAGDDRRRILFVGSSQTWGAGARRDEETFVARLEEILDATAPGPRRFACINAGISAARAADLVPHVEPWLATGRPEMMVINLTSNDARTPAPEFDAAIRAMVEAALAAGARPILVKEPRYRLKGGHQRRHRQLDRIAADYQIPALDPQELLRSAAKSGLLWWDEVHLTSYGQQLMAEYLAARLLPLLGEAGQRRPEAARPGIS